MADDARISFIKTKLETDLLAADLQCSLFMAALSSYRHDTVLRPFPPMFVGESSDYKDYAKLEKTVIKTPDLNKLKRYLQKCNEIQQTPDIAGVTLELLHWMMNTKSFKLKTCDKDKKYTIIKELTGQVVPVPTPTHIFEVEYSDMANDRFKERQGDKGIVYAYHGSRVENFHSILHHGLQGHMSKNFLFGEGTYLCSEMSVSMPYAPSGAGWDKSVLGDRLSCMAVCEAIDDEKYVKCGEKEIEKPDGEKKDLKRINSRSRIAGAEGGNIPEKYYVIRSNDYVRVKYLVLFAEKTKSRNATTTWKSWIKEHKYILMLVFYGFILLAVGLYNSHSFGYYMRRYWKSR